MKKAMLGPVGALALGAIDGPDGKKTPKDEKNKAQMMRLGKASVAPLSMLR